MKKNIAGVLGLFLLTGCVAGTVGGPLEVASSRTPSNPNQEIRYQPAGNIIGGYNHRVPVGPGNWKKLNNEQSSHLGAAHE